MRPRVFFEDFPNTVLYVREIPQTGGWQDVFAADTHERRAADHLSSPSAGAWSSIARRAPSRWCSRTARGTRTKSADPAAYEIVRFEQLIVSLDPESVFPRTGPARGEREMTIAELQAARAELKGADLPFHNPVMEIHKKFSMPVACLVFAVLGVGLGVSNRKDGKLASFVLGIAVIFVYYVIMFDRAGDDQGRSDPGVVGDVDAEHRCSAAGGIALLVAAHARRRYTMRFKLPSWRWPSRQASDDPTGDSKCSRPPSLTPAKPPRGIVVVIRVPQFELPRPNLLDLYVARTYVRMLVMCIVGHHGPVLHLDVHRQVRQAVQGTGHARHDAGVLCGGRRRSFSTTSSPSRCCSRPSSRSAC